VLAVNAFPFGKHVATGRTVTAEPENLTWTTGVITGVVRDGDAGGR